MNMTESFRKRQNQPYYSSILLKPEPKKIRNEEKFTSHSFSEISHASNTSIFNFSLNNFVNNRTSRDYLRVKDSINSSKISSMENAINRFNQSKKREFEESSEDNQPNKLQKAESARSSPSCSHVNSNSSMINSSTPSIVDDPSSYIRRRASYIPSSLLEEYVFRDKMSSNDSNEGSDSVLAEEDERHLGNQENASNNDLKTVHNANVTSKKTGSKITSISKYLSTIEKKSFKKSSAIKGYDKTSLNNFEMKMEKIKKLLFSNDSSQTSQANVSTSSFSALPKEEPKKDLPNRHETKNQDSKPLEKPGSLFANSFGVNHSEASKEPPKPTFGLSTLANLGGDGVKKTENTVGFSLPKPKADEGSTPIKNSTAVTTDSGAATIKTTPSFTFGSVAKTSFSDTSSLFSSNLGGVVAPVKSETTTKPTISFGVTSSVASKPTEPGLPKFSFGGFTSAPTTVVTTKESTTPILSLGSSTAPAAPKSTESSLPKFSFGENNTVTTAVTTKESTLPTFNFGNTLTSVAKTTESTVPKFSFGANTDTTKNTPVTTTQSTVPIFSFGNKTTAVTTNKTTESSLPKFNFGENTTTATTQQSTVPIFSFGNTLAAASENKPSESSGSKFTLGKSTTASVFGLSTTTDNKPASSLFNTTTTSQPDQSKSTSSLFGTTSSTFSTLQAGSQLKTENSAPNPFQMATNLPKSNSQGQSLFNIASAPTQNIAAKTEANPSPLFSFGRLASSTAPEKKSLFSTTLSDNKPPASSMFNFASSLGNSVATSKSTSTFSFSDIPVTTTSSNFFNAGQSAVTTASSLFGTATTTTTTASGFGSAFNFGNNNATTTNKTESTDAPKNLFNLASTAQSNTLAFSFGASQKPASTTPSLFGSTNSAVAPSFGSLSNTSVAQSSPVFNFKPNSTSATPVFGQSTATNPSTGVFGLGATNNSTSGAPVFGMNSGTPAANVFGSSSQQPSSLFSVNSKSASSFGDAHKKRTYLRRPKN